MDPMDLASLLKDLLIGVLLILSLALTTIGGLSWYRTRNPRIKMVSLAFVLFLIKGLFLAVGLYIFDWISVPKDFALGFDVMLTADVIILTLLYLALFRGRGGH